MFLCNKEMTIFAFVVIFVLCLADKTVSSHAVKQDDMCKNRVLIFNTTSNKGDIQHEFRLPYTEVLFKAANDCRTETLQMIPSVKRIGVAMELNFFRAQWSELRRLSRVSSLWGTRLNLLYLFDTSTSRYNFSLFTDKKLASFSNNGKAVITTRYGNDKLVQAYANGFWVDRLKKDAANLGTKWKAFCERLEINRSQTTVFPYIPTPTNQFMTSFSMTSMTISISPSNEADMYLEGSSDALTAAETGSIVAVVVLFAIIVPVAFIVWKWKVPLRNRFERVSTW